MKPKDTITKGQMDKMRKSARRQARIDDGTFGVHRPKVMKDKTKYDRKNFKL